MVRPTLRLIASTVVLLAICLRMALPALHTHGHGAGATEAAAPVRCSCGAVHEVEPARRPPARRGEAPRAEAHTPTATCGCLACEIELGVPCGAADPAAPALPRAQHRDGRDRPRHEVRAPRLTGLPHQRAPPRNRIA